MMPTNISTAYIQEQAYAITSEALAQLDVLSEVAASSQNQRYHVLKDGKAYHCQVEDFNFVDKQMTLVVNGHRFEVQLADEFDLLVHSMGLDATADQGAKDVFAPMPGLVLDILVSPGDVVEKGTPLLILEAMKMENVIKAEGEGIIKEIPLQKGMAVDKKQLLIRLEK